MLHVVTLPFRKLKASTARMHEPSALRWLVKYRITLTSLNVSKRNLPLLLVSASTQTIQPKMSQSIFLVLLIPIEPRRKIRCDFTNCIHSNRAKGHRDFGSTLSALGPQPNRNKTMHILLPLIGDSDSKWKLNQFDSLYYSYPRITLAMRSYKEDGVL